MTITNDTKAQEKQKQKDAQIVLNTDKLGLACTQGGTSN